jgi:hypothetical protein
MNACKRRVINSLGASVGDMTGLQDLVGDVKDFLRRFRARQIPLRERRGLGDYL